MDVDCISVASAPSHEKPLRNSLRLRWGISWWLLAPAVDLAALCTSLTWSPHQAKALVASAVLTVCLLGQGRRYRSRLRASFLDDIPAVLGRSLMGTATVATIFALRHSGEDPDRYLRASFAGIILMFCARGVMSGVRIWLRRTGRVCHPTLIIGGGPVAIELARVLRDWPEHGLSPVGYLDDAPSTGSDDLGIPWLGTLSNADRVVPANKVEMLLVADGAFAEADLFTLINRSACQRCDLVIVPRLHEFYSQAGVQDQIGAIPVMRLRMPALRGPAWKVKRGFDILVSSIALVAMAPVLAVVAAAVRWEGGPGILFRQQRVGQNGRLFEVLKFRSMKPLVEGQADRTWSIVGDERMGPVGRILRRTSLDELPQLWNILRSDMTLVGPRPERPHFVEQFSAAHPRYQFRHRVPAGLTGLAQVSGLRGDTPIADRARYDNYYIENWSLWLDVKVILRTVREVIGARGA